MHLSPTSKLGYLSFKLCNAFVALTILCETGPRTRSHEQYKIQVICIGASQSSLTFEGHATDNCGRERN